jgi:tetratricopeptide (TPR) repeat protein
MSDNSIATHIITSKPGDSDKSLKAFDKSGMIDDKNPELHYQQGLSLKSLSRFKDSIKSLNNVLRMQPDHTRALNDKAQILNEIRKFDKSIKYSEKVLKLDPINITAINNLSYSYNELRKYDLAIEYCEKVLAVDHENVDANINRGNIYFDNGDFPKAIECYEKALQIEPSSMKACNGKGMCLKALKKPEEALQFFNLAIKADPNHPSAFQYKGAVLQEMKKHDEALDCYNHAIDLFPEYANAFNSKGKVLFELKKFDEALNCFNTANLINPVNERTFIDKGNVLMEMKKYQLALESYNKAVEAGTVNPKVYISKGNAFRELKQYEESLFSYDKAIELSSGHYSGYYNKGKSLYQLKRYTEALKNYDIALTIMPNNYNVLIDKGITLIATGETEEALNCFSKSIKLNPMHAESYCIKAELLIRLTRYDDAFKYVNAALKVKPDHANAYKVKGDLLLEFKNYDKAIKYYNKVLEINPDHSKVLNSKGTALYELGNFVEALECYFRAFEGDHNNSAISLNKGVVMIELKQFEEALECLDDAEKAGIVDAVYYKGYVYEVQNKLTEALEQFTQALTKSPNNPVYIAKKGVLLKKMKRYDEAVQVMRTIFEMNLDKVNPLLKESIEWIYDIAVKINDTDPMVKECDLTDEYFMKVEADYKDILARNILDNYKLFKTRQLDPETLNAFKTKQKQYLEELTKLCLRLNKDEFEKEERKKVCEDTTQVGDDKEKTDIRVIERIDYRDVIRKKLAFILPRDQDLVIDYYNGFSDTFTNMLDVSSLLCSGIIKLTDTLDNNTIIKLLQLSSFTKCEDSVIITQNDYLTCSNLDYRAKRFKDLFERQLDDIVGKCLLDMCYEIKYQNTSLQEVGYKFIPKNERLKDSYPDLFGKCAMEYKNLYYKLGVEDANDIIDIILDPKYKSEEDKLIHETECAKYLRAIYVKRIIYVKNILTERNRLLKERNCCSGSCVIF